MIIFNYKVHLGFLVMFLFFLDSAGVNILNGWFLIGCYLGTILPDIDHDSSFLGRWFWFKQSRVHRKFTHSILFCILSGLAGWIIKLSFGLGIVSGSLLHLFTDSFTGKLPYLYYPYKR